MKAKAKCKRYIISKGKKVCIGNDFANIVTKFSKKYQKDLIRLANEKN